MISGLEEESQAGPDLCGFLSPAFVLDFLYHKLAVLVFVPKPLVLVVAIRVEIAVKRAETHQRTYQTEAAPWEKPPAPCMCNFLFLGKLTRTHAPHLYLCIATPTHPRSLFRQRTHDNLTEETALGPGQSIYFDWRTEAGTGARALTMAFSPSSSLAASLRVAATGWRSPPAPAPPRSRYIS